MRRSSQQSPVLWFALFAFLVLNIGLAFGSPAEVVFPMDMAVAAVMGFFLLAILMELNGGRSLLRIFAGAGVFWLAILTSLTAADYFTRWGLSSIGIG